MRIKDDLTYREYKEEMLGVFCQYEDFGATPEQVTNFLTHEDWNDVVAELLEQVTGEKFYAVDDYILVLDDDDGGCVSYELYGVGKDIDWDD